MILYYSGTGNTTFVARSLANLLNEETRFMPHTDASVLEIRDNNLIFCFPVYSWGIPPLVVSFIRRISEMTVRDIADRKINLILVCTAGDEVALTPEMFEAEWRKRGVKVTAGWSVIMPNDYVLLPGFNVDSKEVETDKLRKCKDRVRRIAEKIRTGAFEFDYEIGSLPWLKSRLIYPLFVRWGVNPSKWSASDACIGCGKCEKACPVGNIFMKNDRPEWGKDCVSCTACYQVCPVKAISYGKTTDGKGQYYCHLKPLEPQS